LQGFGGKVSEEVAAIRLIEAVRKKSLTDGCNAVEFASR